MLYINFLHRNWWTWPHYYCCLQQVQRGNQCWIRRRRFTWSSSQSLTCESINEQTSKRTSNSGTGLLYAALPQRVNVIPNPQHTHTLTPWHCCCFLTEPETSKSSGLRVLLVPNQTAWGGLPPVSRWCNLFKDCGPLTEFCTLSSNLSWIRLITSKHTKKGVGIRRVIFDTYQLRAQVEEGKRTRCTLASPSNV